MHLLCIQTSFQKINITMTIYLIIEKIFIINSLRFKQLYCNNYKSFKTEDGMYLLDFDPTPPSRNSFL